MRQGISQVEDAKMILPRVVARGVRRRPRASEAFCHRRDDAVAPLHTPRRASHFASSARPACSFATSPLGGSAFVTADDVLSGRAAGNSLALREVDSTRAPASQIAAPQPALIGWAEYVDIPQWNIKRLRAKMDTGARTSALHVENIRELGRGRVQFDVRLHRRHIDRRVTVEAPIKRRGRVRPSSGVPQTRIFVSARVWIGSTEQEIELSLVDRERMIFRMLIGRSALAHHFLVDVSKRYLLSKPHKKKQKKLKKAKKKLEHRGHPS
jgi:hypothetical protein